MKKIAIFLFFLIAIVLCDYKKLSKYSSVSVIPDTKVYLDISSFETGELISLEFKMDLFFGDDRKSYKFQIDQVPASTYYDYKYWNNLRTVVNKNVTESSGGVCIFKWEEIKKSGNTYIYINVPAPFDDFYSFWGNKIKITNTGGLSDGEIAGIVIGIMVPIIILVAIFIYCKKKRTIINAPLINYTNNPPSDVAYNYAPAYQQPTTYQQPYAYQQPPAYQQPQAYQQSGYQPGALYQNS